MNELESLKASRKEAFETFFEERYLMDGGVGYGDSIDFLNETIDLVWEEANNTLAEKIKEAVKDTSSIEDLTSKLLMIVVHTLRSTTNGGGV